MARKRRTTPRVCSVCGGPLTGGNRAKYCSDACRAVGTRRQPCRARKAAKARHERRVREETRPSTAKRRPCLGHCGGTFMSEGPWNRVCPKCAVLNERQGSIREVHTPRNGSGKGDD